MILDLSGRGVGPHDGSPERTGGKTPFDPRCDSRDEPDEILVRVVKTKMMRAHILR
jgi:hypothetical protein